MSDSTTKRPWHGRSDPFEAIYEFFMAEIAKIQGPRSEKSSGAAASSAPSLSGSASVSAPVSVSGAASVAASASKAS